MRVDTSSPVTYPDTEAVVFFISRHTLIRICMLSVVRPLKCASDIKQTVSFSVDLRRRPDETIALAYRATVSD